MSLFLGFGVTSNVIMPLIGYPLGVGTITFYAVTLASYLVFKAIDEIAAHVLPAAQSMKLPQQNTELGK